MTIKPEALRLANEYYEDHWIVGTKTWCREAVEELRRLHEVNVELLETVKYIANCCQLSLDNPKFKIDETSCHLIRTAIAKATGGNA